MRHLRRNPSRCRTPLVLRASHVRMSRPRLRGREHLTLRPQLDRPQCLSEDWHVRHQPQHLIRYSRTAQTAHAALVQIAEEIVVLELELVRNGWEGEAREKEIEVDAGEGALDDGDVCLGNRLRGSWSALFEARRSSRRTVTSMTPSVSLSIASKSVKNSSRSTCRGTTSSVSMSEPGPCTPRRYEPNVKILPPLRASMRRVSRGRQLCGQAKVDARLACLCLRVTMCE